jgi:hypothetical protein
MTCIYLVLPIYLSPILVVVLIFITLSIMASAPLLSGTIEADDDLQSNLNRNLPSGKIGSTQTSTREVHLVPGTQAANTSAEDGGIVRICGTAAVLTPSRQVFSSNRLIPCHWRCCTSFARRLSQSMCFADFVGRSSEMLLTPSHRQLCPERRSTDVGII